MSQLNDCMLAAVGVTSESQLNDGLRAHYLANGATGGNGFQLQDLEYEFLQANGATATEINDMWLQILPPVVGFIGSLNDMQLVFWCSGGTFAPPAPPAFNANPAGQDPFPSEFSATEETSFSFDCRPYFADGGFISSWSLSGDVPAWMTISSSGIIRGTPPEGDRDYTGIVVSGNNATGPAASSPSTPVVTPANVIITFSPNAQFVEVNRATRFACQAENATGYQWYKNGDPIAGATNFVYTTPLVTQADDNSTYYCEVAGIGGVTKNTTPAKLTAMQRYENLSNGGQALVIMTLAAGPYTLSMLGSGLTTIRGLTATITGL